MLLLIISCIYYEKKNTSDIDNNRVFCSSCQEESLNFSFLYFLVICLFTFFTLYFWILSFVDTQFLTYLFPVLLCRYSSSFFAIIQLSLSYHQETTVQNVYKDIKIYIFLCLPLSFGVYFSCI